MGRNASKLGGFVRQLKMLSERPKLNRKHEGFKTSCCLAGGAAPLAQLIEHSVILLGLSLQKKKGLYFCSLKQNLKLVKGGKR